jgi:predicted nucleic acid-binding protein
MSGVAGIFLDTNILVYARDRSELSKGPFAESLLADIFRVGRPLLSVQVLSEFFWTVTRKLPMPLSTGEAAADIRRLIALTYVAPLTEELLEKALDAVGAYGLPLWDAEIYAAAKLHHAMTVLSEDFQHRRIIDSVTFLNPFAPDFVRSEILGT